MAFSFFAKRVGKATPRFQSQAFIKTMEDQARKFAKTEVLPMYEAGVSNWQDEDKPDFEIKQYIMMNRFLLAVGTYSENFRIYKFVDEGTSIRWAVMSPDWISKTDPKRYWSEAGYGHVVVRGRRMMDLGIHPRPGLQPRDFTGQIMKIMEPWWKKWMADALRLARIDMEMESWK